jgi:hypothetical protein
MYKPYAYLIITYFPTYLLIYETYFLHNWLPRWNQILIQWRFIHNWIIMNIQCMVQWWVLVHCGYCYPTRWMCEVGRLTNFEFFPLPCCSNIVLASRYWIIYQFNKIHFGIQNIIFQKIGISKLSIKSPCLCFLSPPNPSSTSNAWYLSNKKILLNMGMKV